ncbi:thioredoxin-2 isoform X2 [Folsomia candida]|uniref:thioredoxin-2 isoform X2 n=1 Tax=Folsomia candida TaxID=158441 RepID=UPI000B8F5429|nr:thioredoxin-2 isoform X2 [Folsomia candida]
MGNMCGCGKKSSGEKIGGHPHELGVKERTHPLIQKINDGSEFSQVLQNPTNSGKIVVADFMAPWCGPCQQISPAVEKFAEEFSDHAVFIKINVDENDELAMSYGVSSMPKFIIFKDGVKLDELNGANPEKLHQLILQHITQK